MEELGMEDLEKTAQFTKVLGEQVQLAAETFIRNANPGVDFSARAMMVRRKFIIRCPTQIQKYKEQIEVWQSQLADFEALANADKNMRGLQRHEEKRLKLTSAISTLAHKTGDATSVGSRTTVGYRPREYENRRDYENESVGSRRTGGYRRRDLDDESVGSRKMKKQRHDSDSDGESIGSRESKRSGRPSEYLRHQYDSYDEEDEEEVAEFRPQHKDAGRRIGEASNPGPNFMSIM